MPIKTFNELTKNNPQVTPVEQPLQSTNKPFDCQHLMKRVFFSPFPGTFAKETPFKSILPINKAIPPSYTTFLNAERCRDHSRRAADWKQPPVHQASVAVGRDYGVSSKPEDWVDFIVAGSRRGERQHTPVGKYQGRTWRNGVAAATRPNEEAKIKKWHRTRRGPSESEFEKKQNEDVLPLGLCLSPFRNKTAA